MLKKENLIPIAFLIFSIVALIPRPISADAITGNVTAEERQVVNFLFYVSNETNCYSSYWCYPNGSVCNIPPETSCQHCTLFNQTYNGTEIDSASGCLRHFEVQNIDKKSFHLLLKVQPYLGADCFSDSLNCNLTGWNSVAKFYWVGTTAGWYDSAEVDTASCWNWWNSSDEQVQIEQSYPCSVASIYISSNDTSKRIYFDWGNGTGAQIDYLVYVLGYSTSYVNLEERVSPSLKTVFQAVASLVSINIDIWKILYYLFLIIAIIVAVVVIVGFLPLSLKWILKKITA
jgi:hypothetical protein